jgi:hypothetical protein
MTDIEWQIPPIREYRKVIQKEVMDIKKVINSDDEEFQPS